MTLDEFVLHIEFREAKLEFVFDALKGLLKPLLTGHKELLWMNPSLIKVIQNFP